MSRLSEAQPYPRFSTIHEFGNRPDPDNLTSSIPEIIPGQNFFAKRRTLRLHALITLDTGRIVPCTSLTVAGMPALLLSLRSPTLHLPRTIRLLVNAPRLQTRRWAPITQQTQTRCYAQQPHSPIIGTTTPVPESAEPPKPKSPFYFEAGFALYAKRPSRPFPPPFLSLPSTSFSEPLSTHHKSRDRRPKINGEMIRGVTNGDDAVLVSDYFVGANDGVGAWATRERGHAAYVSSLTPLHALY